MQLSRDDEGAVSEENEVRREDQEKINRFSRLHQRETILEEQLKAKQVCFILRLYFDALMGLTSIQKDKEDLEEVSMELELADEDELVP